MNNERPISAILEDILGDLQGIVRAEILLAKTELREEGRDALHAGKGMGAGTLCLYCGMLLFLAGAVAVLSLYMAVWAAAFLLAAVFVTGGAILIQVSRKRLRDVHLAPRRAIENLKENLRWVRQQTR